MVSHRRTERTPRTSLKFRDGDEESQFRVHSHTAAGAPQLLGVDVLRAQRLRVPPPQLVRRALQALICRRRRCKQMLVKNSAEAT